MISIILNAISGLFWAAGKLFDWLYANRLVDAGRTAHRLENLQEQVNAAQKAVEARIAAERASAMEPDRVRDDDGFRRPDD